MPRLRPILLGGICALAGCSTALVSREGQGDFITTVYLTEAEALRRVFPAASRLVKDEARLEEDDRRAAEEMLGSRIAERAFTVHAGVKPDGALDGYAVIHSEIGKFKPFTFIVGVEPEGGVRRVAILVYRESRGGEVVRRRFLVQYQGKRVSDPIHIHRDIINISGATMSVSALNHGVKKVLALVQAVYGRHPERVRALLRRPGAPLADLASTEPPVAAGGSLVELREARLVMGSLCEIRAYGDDRGRLRRAVGRAFGDIEAADRALSDYRPESELSRVARQGARSAVPLSDIAGRFFELAGRIAAESAGAFDLTAGTLVEAWGFRGGRTRPPSPAELEALRPLVGYEKVRLARGPDGRWAARLERDGMRLDPGGLGKGFAADLAARRLAAEGVRAALVDFSGNMYALGAPPGSDAWLVAVRDPSAPSRVLGLLRLRDAAVASSGSYERGIELGGRRLDHVISPRTLRPVEGVLGTAVTAPTAAMADGYAVAAHVLGEKGVEFLEGRTGVKGMVALAGANGAARFISTRDWRLE